MVYEITCEDSLCTTSFPLAHLTVQTALLFLTYRLNLKADSDHIAIQDTLLKVEGDAHALLTSHVR